MTQIDDTMAAFRAALLESARLDKARTQAKYDAEMAYNAYQKAKEEETRAYGAMVKAMKSGI